MWKVRKVGRGFGSICLVRAKREEGLTFILPPYLPYLSRLTSSYPILMSRIPKTSPSLTRELRYRTLK